ncbi:HAD-IIIC family phosphatase [soil metagenome]
MSSTPISLPSTLAADNPAGELLTRLEEAARADASVERLLTALVHLGPGLTADWLLDEEQEARTLLSAPQLGRILGAVIDAAAARRDPALLDAAVELVRLYPDAVAGESAAALAAALPPEQRAERLHEVLAAALTREPANPRLLRLASDLAVQRGEAAEAHALLTRLARADEGLATVRHVFRQRAQLPPLEAPTVRAALLGSFTLDTLIPYLDLECRALGLAPEIYLAPFNSWAQEVLDEHSGLRSFEPEIAFLAVSIDDLVPELAGALPAQALREAGELALERVLGVARRFVESSDAVLVVHGFHSGFRDPLGILQGRESLSRAAWLAELNARLGDALRALPRAYLLDMGELLLRRGGGALNNPKMRHLAGMRLAEPLLGEVARGYAQYIAPLKGLTRKCVVLDLDNTLWGGIVGEDGPHGIRLGNTSPGSEYQELQRYLHSLTERGFLLAINSKNNPEDALEVLRAHEGMLLREESFSAVRMNWQPKNENMLSIAEELGIGLDSLVFIDDNPKERERMRQLLPQVLTPDLPADPALYRQTIEALPQLQTLVVTEEDRARRQLYRAKRQREQVRVSTGSLEEYLRSLEIAVEIAPASESTLARVHQLFQRTNQFNLTTRRYAVGELAALAGDPAWRLYVVRARDRFGDHGLVATALAQAEGEGDAWRIGSFLMSCRVIGYGVETALLATIHEEARMAGASALVGEYIETRKNKPASDFYARHGFSPAEVEGEVARWRMTLEEEMAAPVWIQVMRDAA